MPNVTPTYNGAIPAFPQALSVNINYIDTPVLIDLSSNLIQGKINGVQTVFIDLAETVHDVELIMEDTKQRIYAKAGTSGYYPVLSSQLMKFKTKAKGECKYNIIFINFPIAAGVWGQSGEGGGGGPIEPVIINTVGDGIPLIMPEDVVNTFTATSLIAGNNINLNFVNGSIEIESTATGGGGGGESAPYFYLNLLADIGEINIPAKSNDFLNTDNFFIDSSGNNNLINFTGDPIEFLNFNKSGWYRFDFKISTSSLTGDNYIGLEFSGNGDPSFTNLGFSTPRYFGTPDEYSLSTPATGTLNVYIEQGATMKAIACNIDDAITGMELLLGITYFAE